MKFVESEEFPHHVRMVAPYNPGVNALIKQLPGVFWGPAHGGDKFWYLPYNGLSVLKEWFKEAGIRYGA